MQADAQERQYYQRFLARMSQYPSSIQQSIQRMQCQHGLHAASLTVDALERTSNSSARPLLPSVEQEYQLLARMSRYNFPTQELIHLIHHLHGRHAALIALDTLEQQGYAKYPLALPEL